jgi:hypothetical protein
MPTGSFQQMVIGFSLMVTAMLSGIIMSWYGGQLIDGFYSGQYIPQPIINGILASPAGATVYNGMSGLSTEVYAVNLFYALCFFCGILGLLLFYQGFVKYQSAEGYGVSIGGSVQGNSGGGRMRRRRSR